MKRSDCERQIIDVKRFVLDNQSFIPMMWFENLSDHPQVTGYPIIGEHEKWNVGGIYIDLLDQSTFERVFKASLSQE